MRHSEIESESQLLAESIMDDEYNEDGDEDHVWRDEEAAVTNDSDSSQNSSKTGTRINSPSSDKDSNRDEAVQDDVVSEIICYKISDKYIE